ncbi:MAG: hypothetical protein HY898_21605 [Deltaproteobacteria bacterium]|nr:hypothetical protein [Deltaproteobacteria bacterium]
MRQVLCASYTRTLAAACSALALAACSGSSGPSNNPPVDTPQPDAADAKPLDPPDAQPVEAPDSQPFDAPDSQQPDSPDAQPLTLPAPGSFDVTFQQVTITPPNACFASPAWSSITVARLDLISTPTGFDAVLSPRSGSSWPVQVAVTPDALVLTGEAQIAKADCSEGKWEAWQTLRLQRGADGLLTLKGSGSGLGPYKCQGPYGNTVGDVGPMTAELSLVPDTHAPLADVTSVPGHHVKKLLPWSQLIVAFDEPVAESSGAALLFADVGGAATPVAWTLDSKPAGLWAARGYAGDFNALSGATLSWGVHAGATDAAGNVSVESTQTQAIDSIGPALPSHGFSAAPLEQGIWGKSRLLEGAETQACEASTCVFVDPEAAGQCWSCEMGNSGVAGRLVAGGLKTVAIRYRLLCSAAETYVASAIVRIDIAAPGKGVVASTSISPAKYTALTSAIGSFPYASAWTDALVQVPDSVDAQELGFAIVLYDEQYEGSSAGMACGNDSFMSGIIHGVLLQKVEMK